MIAKDGDLRVWHIPQIPGKPFHVQVMSVTQARLVLRVLANYDLFQYNNNIKGDYANAQSIEIYDDGEWTDWDENYNAEIKKHLEQGEQ